jgi:hypothetical protein
MLWVPQKGSVLYQHNTGGVGNLTVGTTVTTGASSGTKGSATQLISSTNFDSYWVKVIASNYGVSATASQGSLDILVGASGQERVLIPDLLMGYCGALGAAISMPKVWEFPLYIPAGTRISAQAAGARTSAGVDIAVFLYGGNACPPFRVGSKVVTYGVSAVPDGTSITTGVSGAEGSWTQIVASTTEDHFALVPSFQPSATTNITSRVYYLDIGLGAATEEEIAQSFIYEQDLGEHLGGPINTMPCFQDIPSASRLSLRVSTNGSPSNTTNCAIHAVS